MDKRLIGIIREETDHLSKLRSSIKYYREQLEALKIQEQEQKKLVEALGGIKK